MTPKDVLQLAKNANAVMVDLKFVDLLGIWQHTTVPVGMLSEAVFTEGFGFDGSSIRGFQPIYASDMLIVPDATTATLEPFTEHATLSLLCNVRDPLTRSGYSRDPRYVAQKAEAYLKTTDIADTAYFGPESEFFVFDEARFEQSAHKGSYYLDAQEGYWNSGRCENPNLAYKVPLKGGYYPVPPVDSLLDLRTEMCLELQRVGIVVEAQHHEVASGGQCEIDIRFNQLTKVADHIMWLKYIAKNVAKRHGRTVTFMPKPLANDNGSGMHVHQSLWKNNKPLFAGDGYAGLSQLALWYLGGILHHAATLCAFTNPTTNSYRRLLPGYEAPVNLAYSSSNRSVAIRVPMISQAPQAKRLEVRFPDGSAPIYLACAAMLMAGLDGIRHQRDPGAALDRDIFSLEKQELAEIPQVPKDLEAALAALKSNSAFLLQGNVFTEDLLDAYVACRENELKNQRAQPTPMEFLQYFHV